ncbi:hypothetical protein PtA15_1A147 [Puccinia triticina]|uniref:Glycoside hydrolase family 71 protein n=1 Tax=Puccinia triticina TaxID=208348 RepID=A0ABY7C764_9BASI|nr:uncharacterized protein PtA15_1A147 [Puccinia triticina]WAQ80809.1 hypothetical protein PtA15_1A147 [Puccinia triticina]WAR51700.1 hypothetical protein PtB15_1B136 [Puccinia triticina]
MRLGLLSTLRQVVKTLVLLDLLLLSHPTSSARLESSNAPKLVFAHFITGLTVNYTRSDWSSQCNLAASHGIDAFALNVGLPDGWQLQQVKDAYEVADAIKTTTGKAFKLFLSLDMSVIQSAEDVTTWVTSFVPLPAQLLINGRPLVSTFSGEANKLGGEDLSSGWQAALKAPLARGNPSLDALFIPAWSSLDPSTAVSDHPVVDGIMTWNSWPTGSENTNTLDDYQFQTNAKASQKLYMAGVSPCFFTHYKDKNWIYRSDDNLYISRWMKLMSMPTPPDFIQIISWNDYGESHYIGPRLGTPPADTTWLDGFDHQAWLKMSDYFIKWYKTGVRPTIEEDTVHFNYRPHSVNAIATSDTLPPPTNSSVSVDAIYVSTYLSASSPATQLRIRVGDMQQSFSNITRSEVNTFTAPWNGHTGRVEVALLDNTGKELMKKQGDVPISNDIKTYNFNYAAAILSKDTSGTGPARLLRAPIIISFFIFHLASWQMW